MNHIEVLVSNRLLDRCRDHGEAIVHLYKSGKSERSKLCGVPQRRIDENPHVQMMGKLYEVAAAIALGLDPDDDIRWDQFADTGSDFWFEGRGWDVKGTDHPNGRLLIWPSSKTHLYETKLFNALIFVWAERSSRFGRCEVRGWCSKQEFLTKKTEVVAENGRGLEIGTWFLDQDKLHPMSELVPKDAAA